MKRLIVNADDLGADLGRNRGIVEAIEAGMVTSVSILPNGPALEDALQRIRAADFGRVSLGVHLNLSEGFPVSSNLRLLVGPDGCFLGKSATQKLLMHPGDSKLTEEIAKELDAQISKLLKLHVPLDHADGHQHVHILPAALGIVIGVLKSHRIAWTRIPEEHADLFPDPEDPDVEEALFFCTHAAAARPVYEASGLRIPDNFRGLYLKGKLPDSHWTEFLEGIPQGLTELMVHPGRTSPGTSSGPLSRFSTAAREKELQALIDGRFREAMRQAHVELTRFPQETR